jgi:citrate lyase beta subunit
MTNQFKRPDAETRAKSIASLKEAGRLLDLCTLDLDDAIAALDEHLRAQRRARLLHKSNSTPTAKIES